MPIPGPLLLASGTLLLREPSDAADSEAGRPLDAKIEVQGCDIESWYDHCEPE